VIYALLAGPRLGGADAAEGSEEFAFALPPTRAERYLARLALGGSTVLLFTVLGVVTIALDLPQHVWGLFVNSGFTEPFPACKERFLYPLAVAIPFAVFAFSFALAATAGTRGLVGVSWFLGGALAGAALGLAFLGEWALWGEINGYISVLALFALAPLALLAGYLKYIVKEGVSRPAPAAGASSWWIWAIVLVLVLLVLGLFLPFAMVRNPSIEPARGPQPSREVAKDSKKDSEMKATREDSRPSEEPKGGPAPPQTKTAVPDAEKGK